MGARHHLPDRPGGDDDLLLRLDSLTRQRERLLGQRRDALGAIGLDRAGAVDHQWHDRDQREQQQARANAERGLGLAGRLRGWSECDHGSRWS